MNDSIGCRTCIFCLFSFEFSNVTIYTYMPECFFLCYLFNNQRLQPCYKHYNSDADSNNICIISTSVHPVIRARYVKTMEKNTIMRCALYQNDVCVCVFV